jgi:secondary thiamine-phosphate synthase enzyme
MARRIISDGRPVELDAAWKANVVGEETRAAEGAGWRSATLYLWLRTKERRAIVALTDRIRRAVQESGVREGFVLVSAMHISAAVYVNDHEGGIMEDMMAMLDRLAPYRRDYRHHETGEDNADAHLKSLLLHHQVIVPVTGGDLDLGPWQQVFYAEFDGQRRKRVIVKVLGVA